MLSRLATHWIVLKISFEERLVYRGDFALGTLMRFLPVVTQIFLWGAIFVHAGSRIGGYSNNDMIAYYLLTFVGRAFSRGVVADALACILHSHTIEDVSVEDPPLEEVIAEMFALVEDEARKEKETLLTTNKL